MWLKPTPLAVVCLTTIRTLLRGAYKRPAGGSLTRKTVWGICTSTDWECQRIMENRCVGLVLPLSRAFHSPV